MLTTIAQLCFFCGLSCTSVMRCGYRFLRGGISRAVWGNPGVTLQRSVGVQSQCTYIRDTLNPRFQAKENGFRRAGEVTVDRHD